MNIQIKYFSGTGNTAKIAKIFQQCFEAEQHQVELSFIKSGDNISDSYDLIGFLFPVYAFDIPRVGRQYIKQLKHILATKKVFVVITAGDADESGYSVVKTRKRLEALGAHVCYSAVIEMPSNWTVGMNPPTQLEAEPIIKAGVERARKMANDILINQVFHHTFNFPKRLSRWGFYKEYLLFKYLGLSNLWRNFKTYDSCNGCGLCARTCPVKSIEIKRNKPTWNAKCEQCMRCVNYCPRQAIFQSMGGETKDRNKYHEAEFKPSAKETYISA